jgi:uncharacterized membrane protein
MYYINYFFFYSILGHILETFVYFFNSGESGILYCPWTPIYGIGVVIILLIYNKLNQKVKNKILKYILIFFICSFLLSLLELIGGILIEKLFGVIFWSYDNLKFNYGHYISLEISLIWGIASIFVVMLKNKTDKIIKKIPRSISWLLIILMIGDAILTFCSK